MRPLRTTFEQARDLFGSAGCGADERRVVGLDAALGHQLDQLLRAGQEGFTALHRSGQQLACLAHLAAHCSHLLTQAVADVAAGVGRPGHAGHGLLHVGQRAVELALRFAAAFAIGVEADALGKRFHARIEPPDGAHDLFRRQLHFAGQRLDRIGHHAEAAPGVAGALGLDRGIERDEPRLQRHLRDALRRARHFAQRGPDRADLGAHAFDGVAHTVHRLEPACRHVADLALRRDDLCDLARNSRHGRSAALGSAGAVVDQATHFGGLAAEVRSQSADGLDGRAHIGGRRVGRRGHQLKRRRRCGSPE